MTDLEILEEMQKNQQRFDAALRFATERTWWDSEFTTLPIHEAVKRADELIAELEETRTNTTISEDTPF